jgi:hypothetical protein
VGIELLFNFTKSRVFTVLPTASQMNWSQMELNCFEPEKLSTTYQARRITTARCCHR